MIEYKHFPQCMYTQRIFIYENSPLPNVPYAIEFETFLKGQATEGWQLAGIIPGEKHPIAEHGTMSTVIMVRNQP